MDAALTAACASFEWFDPKTRAPLRNRALRNVRVTHQARQSRVLVETVDGRSILMMPVSPGDFQLFTKCVGDGKFTILGISCSCYLKVSGAPVALARILTECVATGHRAALPSSAAAASAGGGSNTASASSSSRPVFAPILNTGTRILTAAESAVSAPAAAASSAASIPAPAAAAAASLTAEQATVVQCARSGVSLFFTGAAGTGKSMVLHELRRVLPASTTAFTGTTGVAAVNIGGTTLHTWAGVTTSGLDSYIEGRSTLLEFAATVRHRKDALLRWRSVTTLIIDEVSMLEADAFDAMEALARSIRGDARPFGGIVLVVSGDFFQLPPVGKSQGAQAAARRLSVQSTANSAAAASALGSHVASSAASAAGSTRSGVAFAFAATSWKKCIRREVELTTVFRQKDAAFSGLLNELRWGRCTETTTELLRSRWGAKATVPGLADDIIPTKLFTHRADVDTENSAQLGALTTPVTLYRAQDTFVGERNHLHLLEAACPAPKALSLKVGAQVMFIKTLDQAAGLVNGARGVVVAFSNGMPACPIVKLVSGATVEVKPQTWTVEVAGRVVASRKQLPLDLAWAISIHKSQGMSLDAVEVNLSRTFEYGQAYVALSRARSLAGLTLVDRFNPTCVRVHPDAVAYYSALRERNGGKPAAAAAAALNGGKPAAAPAVHAAARTSQPSSAAAASDVTSAAAAAVRRASCVSTGASSLASSAAATAVVAPSVTAAALPQRPASHSQAVQMGGVASLAGAPDMAAAIVASSRAVTTAGAAVSGSVTLSSAGPASAPVSSSSAHPIPAEPAPPAVDQTAPGPVIGSEERAAAATDPTNDERHDEGPPDEPPPSPSPSPSAITPARALRRRERAALTPLSPDSPLLNVDNVGRGRQGEEGGGGNGSCCGGNGAVASGLMHHFGEVAACGAAGGGMSDMDGHERAAYVGLAPGGRS